jgi:hypothetical protein
MRYGRQVLDVETSHLLFQQLPPGQARSPQDLTKKWATLRNSGVVDKDGKPDIAKWLQTATQGRA